MILAMTRKKSGRVVIDGALTIAIRPGSGGSAAAIATSAAAGSVGMRTSSAVPISSTITPPTPRRDLFVLTHPRQT